jgi:isocitrate/isopropylmalate dehydrogenase
MMLRHSFWMEKAAISIENAVDKTISDWFRTWDIYRKIDWETLVGTKEIGEEIINRIKQ